MEPLNELFNRAKNITPPLSEAEAEQLIINNRPQTQKKAAKLRIFRWGWVLIPATIIATVVFWQSNSPKPATPATANSGSTTIAQNAPTGSRPSAGTAATHENNLQNNATATPKNGDNTTAPVINNTTTNTDNNNKNTSLQKNSNRTYTQQKNTLPGGTTATPPAKEPPYQELPATTDENKTTITTETIAAPDSSPATLAQTETATQQQDSATVAKTDLTAPVDTPNPMLAKSKDTSPVYNHPKWLAFKIDVLGLLYNNALRTTIYSTWVFDTRKVTTNRLALGLEYMPHKRISIAAGIGFGTCMYSMAGGSNTRNGGFYEQYINYKGTIFNIEARYYYLANYRHHRAYIAPYFAYGKLQERIFLAVGSPGGNITYNTIATSRGITYGIGLGLGYKFIYKNFYIELSGGLIIAGTDRKFFNDAIDGQNGIYRYQNLRKLELAIGVTF
jgi:hypothetical protein